MLSRQKRVQTHYNELIVVIKVLDGPHTRHANLRIECVIRAEEKRNTFMMITWLSIDDISVSSNRFRI